MFFAFDIKDSILMRLLFLRRIIRKRSLTFGSYGKLLVLSKTIYFVLLCHYGLCLSMERTIISLEVRTTRAPFQGVISSQLYELLVSILEQAFDLIGTLRRLVDNFYLPPTPLFLPR
jgi:hypothetical protein